LFRINANISSERIVNSNFGEGKAAFSFALESMSKVNNKQFAEDIAQIFVLYFSKVVSEQRVDVVKELFAMMVEKGLIAEQVFIDPFRIALTYWEKGKDAEVLDRLNPEVREIVEQIIRNAESPSEADR
ncbi:MAG TPA: hypothetical protein VGA99_15800, partial [bacterium]